MGVGRKKNRPLKGMNAVAAEKVRDRARRAKVEKKKDEARKSAVVSVTSDDAAGQE